MQVAPALAEATHFQSWCQSMVLRAMKSFRQVRILIGRLAELGTPGEGSQEGAAVNHDAYQPLLIKTRLGAAWIKKTDEERKFFRNVLPGGSSRSFSRVETPRSSFLRAGGH